MEPDPLAQTAPGQDDLLQTARRVFKIDFLYPYQRLAAHNILAACGLLGAGEEDTAPGDQIVILPTGAGKSLCFQLPAVVLNGLSVVVYPLLALMADQLRRLETTGLQAVLLRGGMRAEERADAFRRLSDGKARLLITNPETLASPAVLPALKDAAGRGGIDHLVIDEAHCISEWGESFRPAYLELGRLRRELAPRVTTAFTATASPLVLDKIRLHLFSGQAVHTIVASADRPNIRYAVLPSLCKDHSLVSLLDAPGAQRAGQMGLERPAIVFVRSRPGAENLSRYLRGRCASDEVFFYHAGLERPEKTAVEKWFFSSRDGVLVATCAYGMGVDKPDIRTVIHRDIPSTVEAYLQESGRAGRDGRPASAVLVCDPLDAAGSRERGESDEAGRRYRELLAYAAGTTCRRAQLLRLLGQSIDFCTGCDVCDGLRSAAPDAEAELRRFVQKNRRRYNARETGLILSGRRNYHSVVGGLCRLGDFGSLSGWTRDEIETALGALETTGAVRTIGRGPWKGKLTAARGLNHPAV